MYICIYICIYIILFEETEGPGSVAVDEYI